MKKAVSERLFSAAIACSTPSGSQASRGHTAAGLPAKTRSVKASTWKMGILMTMECTAPRLRPRYHPTMSETPTVAARFAALVELIARLRAPGGCPWDREQTHESLKPMTLEEAYEVLEAIDDGDDPHLASELGDLLLQVVFHSQIAAEGGRFSIGDVIDAVSDKMTRRHPHVFGGERADTPQEVLRNWEALKQAERAGKGAADASMLDSVSSRLPAVMEAFQ